MRTSRETIKVRNEEDYLTLDFVIYILLVLLECLYPECYKGPDV